MPPLKPNDTTPLLRAQQPSYGGPSNSNSSYQYYNNFSNFNYPGRNNRVQTVGDLGKDPHSQFCALTGCPPTNAPPGFKYRINERTLYGRVVSLAQSQALTYNFAATAVNFLLLAQIVLGAALTGLGNAHIPGWVISLIGATNTIIAGLVTYLKSRGQPMRARAYRDDLERVVDEIENSEVMWLGISKAAHGYDDIDTDNEVTVRSEVARLTRLLDRAIRSNTANNPDQYVAGMGVDNGSQSKFAGLRQSPFMTQLAANVPEVDASKVPAVPVAAAATTSADEAPAEAAKGKKEKEKEKEEEAKKAAEEEAKKKEAEEAKKKADEEAAKKKEEEEAAKKAETSTASDSKGKQTETNTASSFIRSVGSSVQSSLMPSQDTKKEESRTETSSRQESSSKKEGGSSGGFGLSLTDN